MTRHSVRTICVVFTLAYLGWVVLDAGLQPDRLATLLGLRVLGAAGCAAAIVVGWRDRTAFLGFALWLLSMGASGACLMGVSADHAVMPLASGYALFFVAAGVVGAVPPRIALPICLGLGMLAITGLASRPEFALQTVMTPAFLFATAASGAMYVNVVQHAIRWRGFVARQRLAEAQREAARLSDAADAERVRAQATVDVLRLREAELIRTNQALNEARHAAEASDEAKTSFLANMSHELRTPLNVIIGYAQMLREEVGHQDTRLDADLARIEASGGYLVQLVSDVLDLSKVAAGQLDVRLQQLDLTEMLVELVSVAEALCVEQDNTLRVALPAFLPEVQADPIRVRQIVLNLLSNATKFSSRGTVTLAAGADGHQVWIRVDDTGIGMSEAQIQQLFKPFVQVHQSSPGRFGGTGLGLALSRQLATHMGADILVRSQLGKGSSFELRFTALRINTRFFGDGELGSIVA